MPEQTDQTGQGLAGWAGWARVQRGPEVTVRSLAVLSLLHSPAFSLSLSFLIEWVTTV